MTNENEQEHHPTTAQEHPSGGYVAPSIGRNTFCCPHCGAFAHQKWHRLAASARDSVPLAEDGSEIYTGKVQIGKLTKLHSVNAEPVRNLHISRCEACKENTVWVHSNVVFPPQRSGPQPNLDLPNDIKDDYEEARTILNLSPRGAAALLRLCVEKLCNHLGAAGGNLNKMIEDLVWKGLDERVQKSLDVVRVIGNEAVHPGQMDVKDDRDMAETLFSLVNLISEKMISGPKHVDAVYASLPKAKLDEIERRGEPSKRKPQR